MNWKEKAKIDAKLSDNALELAIPKSVLNLKGKNLEFKWADNTSTDGDIMKFYDQGDVAPNARFTYRYKIIIP
jgi:hypothetical protein